MNVNALDVKGFVLLLLSRLLGEEEEDSNVDDNGGKREFVESIGNRSE